MIVASPAFAFNLREVYESAVDAYNKAQYDQAIELYQQINKEAPQFSPAYIGIGLSLIGKGADFEEVLYYYKMAVDKDPTNAQACDQLGRLYYSNGQLDKARYYFEKALKINSNMPQVKLALGWIYLTGKKINPTVAIANFKDAIKLAPSPNAYFGLGMAYFSNNEREKVLDIITLLKDKGESGFASKLEKALRDNRRIILNGQDDSGDDQGEPAPKATEFEKTSSNPKGIKVRLKGKLDNL